MLFCSNILKNVRTKQMCIKRIEIPFSDVNLLVPIFLRMLE